MIQRQVHIFLTAVMFYTRIPCPKWVNHSEKYLTKSTIYFPVIGWIAGTLAALVVVAGMQLWSSGIAILLSMIAGILLTGAFHEDGFADVCDGFGGGWTQAKILEIMKDSRVGAYGVIGILLMLALKYSAIYQIVSSISSQLTSTSDAFSWHAGVSMGFIFLIAHTLSRFTAVTIIYRYPYARANEDSKAKPVAKKLIFSDLLLAVMFTAIPLAGYMCWQQSAQVLWVLLPLGMLHGLLGRYFMKWIGGYTGDCLGATQQLAEVIIYACFANTLWKFF